MEEIWQQWPPFSIYGQLHNCAWHWACSYARSHSRPNSLPTGVGQKGFFFFPFLKGELTQALKSGPLLKQTLQHNTKTRTFSLPRHSNARNAKTRTSSRDMSQKVHPDSNPSEVTRFLTPFHSSMVSKLYPFHLFPEAACNNGLHHLS